MTAIGLVLFASASRCAEPPKDFLTAKFGLILDFGPSSPGPSDSGLHLAAILTTFTNAFSKTWEKETDDQWILRTKKKDLATESIVEATWVFHRSKTEPDPLVVLTRLIVNRQELPPAEVAAVAINLTASAAPVTQNEPPPPPLQPIQPFGGLNWDDGIVQTILKLNRMQGIKKVYAGNLDEVFPGPGRKALIWDPIPPSPTMERMRRLEMEGSRQSQTNTEDRPPDKNLQGLATESNVITAISKLMQVSVLAPQWQIIDKEGKQWPLASGMTCITATPIHLKGIPFAMTLNFQQSPGFALSHPKTIFCSAINCYYDWPPPNSSPGDRPPRYDKPRRLKAVCAFALTRVTLHCIGPMPRDKMKEIVATLRLKYEAYSGGHAKKEDEIPPQGHFKAQDTFGGYINANWDTDWMNAGSQDNGKATLVIDYSRSTDQFDNLYNALLADLAKKAASKKPDRSGEL